MACMSRFVDQFVVLFDASKPTILVTVRTDTKYSACATLHSRSWWSICPLLLQKRKKKPRQRSSIHIRRHAFCKRGSQPGTLSVSAAAGLEVRRAHAAGSVKPLISGRSDRHRDTHTHTPAAALRRHYAWCPPRPRVRSGRRCRARCCFRAWRGVAWSPGLDWASALGVACLLWLAQWLADTAFGGGRSSPPLGSSLASRRCGLNRVV